MSEVFKKGNLKKLKFFIPRKDPSGKRSGQVTIIGGSNLFHGAPLLSLKVASRIVDMVFFASPEKSVGKVAEEMKSKLMSFIWVPWEDVEGYIKKSDAILIGPGLMRFRSEKVPEKDRLKSKDSAYKESREVTKKFLEKFPDKKWVIDAGSLQTMDAGWIPKDSVLTPNEKEFNILFGDIEVGKAAQKYDCTIVSKGKFDLVCSSSECFEIRGGNVGLTKGGTGDVLAGLTVSLLAKNEPLLTAASAAFVVKASAEALYKKVGMNYNADDLADKIPEILHELTS